MPEAECIFLNVTDFSFLQNKCHIIIGDKIAISISVLKSEMQALNFTFLKRQKKMQLTE